MGKIEIKEKQIIFDKKLIYETNDKLNDGIILKRYQNPWLKGEIGVRRSGVKYRMSPEEQEEYVKCAIDIHHFVKQYCMIKNEDGEISKIEELRDYQEEMLNNFITNRFNILMCARQSGKTITASIFMLHFILFNNDKNIMIVANKGDTAIEIIDKLKSIYSLLPFYMKPGIKVWNQKSITFENGCRIKSATRTKSPAIGFSIDVLFLDEFAHIPSTIIEPYYTAVFPTISAIKNSKIIITSTPNGPNLFHKLLTDAERPDGDPLKNNYKPMRVYWHQVPGRFATYIRLNDHLMYEYGVTKEDIFKLVSDTWSELTKVKMAFNLDKQKHVITITNNKFCSDEDIKKMVFIDKDGKEVSVQKIAEITTWKEEAIKDIGGEDAFNQEYGLRFINASKSLLSEDIIDELLHNKKNYVWEEIPEFNRLRFDYHDLKWVDDDDIFIPLMRKNYKIVIAVDLSEGLGQDYSVINIFRIREKEKELVEFQKAGYTSFADFYKLEQIGIYRNNYVSIKQMAELLYLIIFEYFNPDNCKVVLELNTYGNTLLAELPHVFEGNNNYGSSIFMRYKHRADSNEEKIGLKVGDNKGLFVKDYQDLMQKKSISITNEDNIREVTTFVKHNTTAGNVKYAADTGHDDTVMTLVDMSTIFKRHEFNEMVSEWSDHHTDKEYVNYMQDILKNMEYVETVDYSQVLKVRKQNKARYKTQTYEPRNKNWFGTSI